MKKTKSSCIEILFAGFGGQGLITLIDIAVNAAFINGYDAKSSELHGLSQRGGAVATFLSFGKKVYSPLFKKAGANLIIGLELLEGLRACDFANSKTKILVNDYFSPFLGITPKDEILKNLRAIGKDNFNLVEASEICKEKLEKEVLAGMYLLGYAVNKKLIPIKPESVVKAIKEVIPEKYQEINIKAFKLAHDN